MPDFRIALSTVAVDPDDWIENMIEARATVAMDDIQRTAEWPVALISAGNASVDTTDAYAVLEYAISAGIIKTAAQRQAEIMALQPPAPPVAAITRQQAALEMLARGMVTATEAVDLAATGTAPAWISALIEILPIERQAPALIEITYSTWRRENGMLSSLSSLPGAPEIDIDEFFTSAANR